MSELPPGWTSRNGILVPPYVEFRDEFEWMYEQVVSGFAPPEQNPAKNNGNSCSHELS